MKKFLMFPGVVICTVFISVLLNANSINIQAQEIESEQIVEKTAQYELKNGLYYEDGVWWYYQNNEIDYSYVGFAEADGQIFYVSGGSVDESAYGVYFIDNRYCEIENGRFVAYYSGIQYVDGDNAGSYLIKDGYIQYEYTGVIEDNNEELRYILNGKLIEDYSGMAEYQGKFLVFENGYFNIGYSGTYTYDGETYFVKDGIVTFDYEGIVFDHQTYSYVYIKDGKINTSFNGVAVVKETEQNVTLEKIIYLQNGIQSDDFKGLSYFNGEWLYFEGGYYQENYNNLVQFGDSYVYVENGKLNTNYTGTFLFYNEEIESSVECIVIDGVARFDYTGAWKLDDDNYRYFSNGIADYNFTGLVFYENEWLYFNDGYIFYTTGVIEYNGETIYLFNGKPTNYTGLVDGYYDEDLDMPINYYIENGKKSSFTGLIYIDDNWYLLNNGETNYGFTGLQYFNNNWVYVANGVLNAYYTGLTQFGEDLMYVNEGMLDTTFTGVIGYDDNNNWKLFYVVDGVVAKDYTGYYYDVRYDMGYDIVSGKVSNFTGSKFIDNTLYYFTSGSYNKYDLILGEYEGTYFAFYGGVFAPWYTGGIYCYTLDDYYYVTNGVLDPYFTGYANIANIYGNYLDGEGIGYFENGRIWHNEGGLQYKNYLWTYLSSSGILQNRFTGVIRYGENLVFIENGFLKTDYVGGAYYLKPIDGSEDEYEEFYGYWEFDHFVDGKNGYYSIGNDSYVLLKNGEVDKSFTQLVYIDGKWRFFINGVADYYNSGLAPYGDEHFYVHSNTLDTSINGYIQTPIYFEDGTYEYLISNVVNGQINRNCNGLYWAPNFYSWVYFENGVQSNYTGLMYYAGNWIYIKDGMLDTYTTDLIPFGNDLVYINEGKLQADFTGLVELFDEETEEFLLYYVENGKFNGNYTGLVADPNGYSPRWANNGIVNNQFEGLVFDKNSNQWIFIEYGSLMDHFSGFIKYENDYFLLEKGVLNPYTGAYFTDLFDGEQQTGYRCYQVENGKIVGLYTGVFEDYYIVDGERQYDFNGVLEFNGVLYYIEYGSINTSPKVYEYKGKLYCFNDGVVNTEYTGAFYSWDQGKTIYFKNGVAVLDYTGEVTMITYEYNMKVTTHYIFKNGEVIEENRVTEL